MLRGPYLAWLFKEIWREEPMNWAGDADAHRWKIPLIS